MMANQCVDLFMLHDIVSNLRITNGLFPIDYMSTKLEQPHFGHNTRETIKDLPSILHNSVSVIIKVSKYLSRICAPPPSKSSTNQLTSTS